jgi:PAS domain-containing protein
MAATRHTTALVIWRPIIEPDDEPRPEPSPLGIVSLLSALSRLARRGSGPAAWASPFGDDPIAFLLDSTGDGILVWSASGHLLYANRAAEALHLEKPAVGGITRIRIGDRELERRSLRFDFPTASYAVEIVRTVLAVVPTVDAAATVTTAR